MKVSELFEGRSVKAAATEVFGDKATVKGSKIIVPMEQEVYNKTLAKTLMALEFADGRDWSGEWKDGNAILSPLPAGW